MSHAIEIQGLVKEYKPGHPILKGIDLKIGDAGLIAIIGPSGTGKSTLIRCINRLVDPSRGAIWFEGEGKRVNLAELRGRALREQRRHIGMVFQEYNLVERLSVMENLLCGRLGYVNAFTAWRRNFAKEDIAHAFELLDTVGLGNFANQRADALSGGQRQRVGIARALASEPAVIVADEPVSALDVSIRAQILRLMAELQRARGLAYLFITHDLGVVRALADRVLVMTGGRVVESGSADEVLERPQHAYTQRLLAATPVPDPGRQSMRDAQAQQAFIAKGRTSLAHSRETGELIDADEALETMRSRMASRLAKAMGSQTDSESR